MVAGTIIRWDLIQSQVTNLLAWGKDETFLSIVTKLLKTFRDANVLI